MTNLVLDISFGERERSPQNNLGSCVIYTWTMALEVLSYGHTCPTRLDIIIPPA